MTNGGLNWMYVLKSKVHSISLECFVFLPIMMHKGCTMLRGMGEEG